MNLVINNRIFPPFQELYQMDIKDGLQNVCKKNDESELTSEDNTAMNLEGSDTKGDDPCTDSSLEQKDDPYIYTKRDEFTSEIYKIEIGGLPVRFGFGQLRKLLNNKLNLKSRKIKGSGTNSTWVFVTFSCEEDRSKALSILQGYKWKGKILQVKKAAPVADPLVKKRQIKEQESDSDDMKANKKLKVVEEIDLPASVLMKQAVSPLYNIPYEEQLKKKELKMQRFITKLSQNIEKCYVVSKPQKSSQETSASKIHTKCVQQPIHPSPVINGYRNKCEFTIGLGPNGTEQIVGFRLARYSAGSMTVAPIEDCDIIPESMKKVVKAFQDYIQVSDKPPFNPESHAGYWRQLTVRCTRNKDIMVTVVIHPQTLTQEDLMAIKEELKDHFESGVGKDCGITSMYFQQFAKRESGEDPPLQLIFGNQYMHETLLDLKFRISPDAFFQVNTAGAEVLYKLVRQLCIEEKASTIFDVCCGTGSIGICLAKDVNKVVGIEMIPHAIEDARTNASLNDIKNTEFICGRAEDVIYQSLGEITEGNIVAVVDPPRAGLHNRVIRTLRTCSLISCLIYISCDPQAAKINFLDLCRPTSNQYKGDPFLPTVFIPVDLFPHTNHCELVLVFKRSSCHINTLSVQSS